MSCSPLASAASAPSPLHSTIFSVQQTDHAGRSIFATQSIPAGTHLHTSSSPVTFVIFREYRREVCSECFRYDRGRTWKLSDAATGIVWCSDTCKQLWHARWGDETDAIEALIALEKFVRKSRAWNNGEWDAVMLDAAGTKPLEDAIETAWRSAENGPARIISGYRSKDILGSNGPAAPTKAERKAVNATLSEPPAPDILSYLLSAVLAAKYSPETWSDLLNLHAASMPYSSPSALNQHIEAYKQLYALMPHSLLPYITPSILCAASTRDAHNSFGLRSLDDGGSEMFGFGVWPSASYWNHSCAPNVSKRRVGRSWQFETSADVTEGQELCITYLGGEEKELGLKERRKRLKDIWGFDCACLRCSAESIRF